MEEPVEIELRLNQNVDTEGKKATDSIDDISAASQKMRRDFEANIAAQQQVIKQLTGELANLKKIIETPAKSNDKQADEIARLTAQVAEAERALAAMQSQHQAASKSIVTDTEKMTSATRDYVFANKNELAESINVQKRVIAELKNEIATAQAKLKENSEVGYSPRVAAENQKLTKIITELKKELQGESEALSELQAKTQVFGQKSATLESQLRQVREAMAQLKLEGKENSAEYSVLEKKLGTLGTAYREMYQTQRQLSTGGSQMAGLLQGLSALSGALAAGAGAFGIINSESENFQKIQTKVQSLMAITIGLQQISVALHKTSAFRITTVTKAKELWAIATTRLSVALGISNVAAAALMATLTLGLSVAITAIIAAIGTFTKRQRAAAEETKKFNEAVAESASATIATYAKLKKGFADLNGDVQKQAKYIRENKKEFDSLGVAINDVNEAERLFSQESTTAFENAIEARAKAMANMEIAAEKYREYLLKKEEAQAREKTPTKIDEMLSSSAFFNRDGERILLNQRAVKEAAKINKEADASLSEFTRNIKDNVAETKIAEAEMSKVGKSNNTIIDYTKAYWEKQKKDAQAALELMTDAQKGGAEWNRQLKLYSDANKKLKNWDFSEKKPDKKEEDQKLKARDTLKKMAVDLQQDIDAATIAAMQEGAAKKLAEVTAEFEKRKATIAQKLAEIEELEKKTGAPATGQRNLLAKALETSNTQYEAEKKRIEDEAQQEVDSVFADINEKFTTRLQNQLNKIDQYYAEQLQKLRENITDRDQLEKASAQLYDAQLRERSLAANENQLHTLEFEEQIALKRQEISNRELIWETDKQKKLLEIQLDYAMKRLRFLNDAKINGGDVDEEINQTRELIGLLSGDIASTAVEKFSEIADAIVAIGDAVADFISIFDEDLGKLAGWGADAIDIASSISKGDYVGAAQKVLNLTAEIIKANREANKEIQQFNYDLAQQAIDYSLEVIKAVKDIKSETDSLFSTDIGNALTQSMASYNQAIEQQTGFLNDLAKATIKTGVEKKKFIGIVYGTRDVYSSLLETFPKLIDENGKLNRELAQTLIGSGNLNEETTDLVQNLLDAGDAANDAMQQFEDTLSSLIGQLGDDLKTTLDDSFASGTDAAKKMMDTIGDYLNKMFTAQLFHDIFGDDLKKLREGIGSSYDPDNPNADKDVTDDFATFAESIPELTARYNEALKGWKETMAQNGFDVSKDTTRTASSKGIAQASQETVDELNGRITNIQQIIFDIRNNGAQSLNVNNELLNHQRMIRSGIDTIAENSNQLKRLEKIENSLSDINLKGVKIKS